MFHDIEALCDEILGREESAEAAPTVVTKTAAAVESEELIAQIDAAVAAAGAPAPAAGKVALAQLLTVGDLLAKGA